MKIQGNTTGSYAPRADYAVTDPKNPAFIKNKPNEAIKSAQDAATAAKTAADAASTAAQKAQSTADNALPKSGGVMKGALKLEGPMVWTEGVNYGTAFTDKFLNEDPVGTVFGILAVSEDG